MQDHGKVCEQRAQLSGWALSLGGLGGPVSVSERQRERERERERTKQTSREFMCRDVRATGTCSLTASCSLSAIGTSLAGAQGIKMPKRPYPRFKAESPILPPSPRMPNYPTDQRPVLELSNMLHSAASAFGMIGTGTRLHNPYTNTAQHHHPSSSHHVPINNGSTSTKPPNNYLTSHKLPTTPATFLPNSPEAFKPFRQTRSRRHAMASPGLPAPPSRLCHGNACCLPTGEPSG